MGIGHWALVDENRKVLGYDGVTMGQTGGGPSPRPLPAMGWLGRERRIMRGERGKEEVLPAMVKDARGRRCRLVSGWMAVGGPRFSGGGGGSGGGGEDGIKRDKRERLSRAALEESIWPSRGELARALPYVVLCLPLFALAAFAPALMSFKLRLPLWAMMLAAVPLGMIPAIVTVFVIRRAGAERIARVHVRAELCGSCGYELRGIAPEADGCTVCPECGGAWRVDEAR